jgi:threonine dehydrogenase-like Zn-dependent dehydrogenase
MQQLMFERPGRLRWREVAAPALENEQQALVRPIAVARCDLDAAVLRGEAPFRGALLHFARHHLPEAIGQRGLFRNAPFRGPYAFGHECVAEVVAIGGSVRTVAVGDRVVVPFQIACGACGRCTAGLTAHCTAVPERSMYGFGELGGHGWGGVLCDVVRVPFADGMLLKAPEGVSAASLASAGDNVVDGHRTVAAPLAARPGAPVLVVGGLASSVGLYAVACARALGAETVVYLDEDPVRLSIAERLGAEVRPGPPRRQRQAFPITVDASAAPAGLAAAMLSTEPGGVCTSTGIYYEARTPVPLREAYGIGLTFLTGRVQARAELPAVLALMARGALAVDAVTSLVAPWDESPAAFLHAGPKVIVTRA